MGVKEQKEAEEWRVKAWKSNLLNLAQRMLLALPLQHHEVSRWCSFLHGSQMVSAEPPLLMGTAGL